MFGPLSSCPFLTVGVVCLLLPISRTDFEGDEDETPKIPISVVDGNTLAKVVEFLNQHKDEEEPKPYTDVRTPPTRTC